MKKILLLALLISPVVTFGQEYHKMINESFYWDVPYADMGYICSGFGDTGPFRYSISGDTLINNTSYSKIFISSFINLNIPPAPNCPPFAVDTVFSLFPYYFLREDTVERKVWRYSTFSGEDELLYDFTLLQGDSIENIETCSFHTIDTIYNIITNDGISRKKYEFGGSQWIFPGGFYIEGIGGAGGLFEVPFYFFEEGSWLMCVKDNNNTIYGNYNCYDFISSVPDIDNNLHINMYPNPTSGKFWINNPNNKQDFISVEIFNSFGKKLMVFKTSEDLIPIDLSEKPKGVYLIRIKSGLKIFTEKIIVQ